MHLDLELGHLYHLQEGVLDLEEADRAGHGGDDPDDDGVDEVEFDGPDDDRVHLEHEEGVQHLFHEELEVAWADYIKHTLPIDALKVFVVFLV